MQLNNNIVNYIVSQKCPPHYFLNSYIKNKPTLIGWLVGLRFNGAFNKEWVISPNFYRPDAFSAFSALTLLVGWQEGHPA